MIIHGTICSGFRTLTDYLDENIAELSNTQQKELMEELRKAWAICERRKLERRVDNV